MFKNKYAFFLTLPSLAIIFFISLYPFIYAFYLSLTNAQLTRSNIDFIGISNYYSIFRSHDFWIYLQNTGLYTTTATFVEVFLGLAIALLIDAEGVKGKQIFRTLILLPLMIPPVVGALMWKIMLDPERGPINFILSRFGLSKINWLGSSTMALPTVTLVDIYLFTPFAILVILAGLQSLPPQVIEASKVDGAGGWKTLRYIIFPMIQSIILLVILIRLALTLTSFEIIYVLTKGGPGISTMTLNIQAYTNFYRYFYSGLAAAYGFILWIIIFIITNLLVKKTRQGWEE